MSDRRPVRLVRDRACEVVQCASGQCPKPNSVPGNDMRGYSLASRLRQLPSGSRRVCRPPRLKRSIKKIPAALLLRLTPSRDQARAEGLTMRHYAGVFVPLEPGGWRALFPDFPECIAEGPNLEITIFRATDSLLQHAQSPGSGIGSLPTSRTATAGRLDETWATTHGFSLRTAVIAMIPLPCDDDQQRGRNEALRSTRDQMTGQAARQIPPGLRTPSPREGVLYRMRGTHASPN